MLRLFVGIDLPPELKLGLSTICVGVPGVRWIDPGNFHVTIRFIGEVDEGLAGDIDETLSRIRAPRFDLSLASIGTFGTRQLYVGVKKNDALFHLRDKIDSALVHLGLEPEGRRYTPHVSLARIKSVDDRLHAFIRDHALYRAPPFAVDRFSLIASYLTKAGPIYEDRADYRLI
jgi:2'-5' RNA ligase